MYRIFIMLMLVTFVMGCKEQEVPRFEDVDALAFYRNAGGEVDSLSYSFATTGLGKQVDTIFLKMRVIGKVVDYDRPMKLRAANGSTARSGVDYKLNEFNIPRGVAVFLYPLIVYKTPEMKTQTLRLVLEAEQNDQFKGLAAEGLVLGRVTAENTYSLRKMKIDIADKIIKPSFWNGTTDAYFGTYSNAKYIFMIGVYGTGDFRSTSQGGTWTANAYNLATIKLRNELLKYEALNGPLMDENGNKVEF